jgi:hypothetical protein
MAVGGIIKEIRAKTYDRHVLHSDVFSKKERYFLVKKQRQGRKQRGRNRAASSDRKIRDQVLSLTAKGMNRELVAAQSGVTIAKLRTDFARELDEGRFAARAVRNEIAVTRTEYCFLDAAVRSFSSHWFSPQTGNDLYAGMDGNGAKNILDAFARWKEEGGTFITTGLTSKQDPQKVAEFSKIIARYKTEICF